jgi:hypothetical protein
MTQTGAGHGRLRIPAREASISLFLRERIADHLN